MKDKGYFFSCKNWLIKKEAFSRIEDTMFLQNNFLLMADYNFC